VLEPSPSLSAAQAPTVQLPLPPSNLSVVPRSMLRIVAAVDGSAGCHEAFLAATVRIILL
jgi:hypothetical protein